jgi:type I restriction enzyme M protein
MVLNKNKPKERKRNVLFINASKEYQQHSEVRKLNQLGEEHIKRIVRAYKEFRNEEGFSKSVEIGKIIENDYNLNVTLYVFPEEETEEIDVAKEWEELRRIEKEITVVEEKIEGYLKKLHGG